ncbi:MAG: phosphatase PAP2 family protein [Thermomonas sp.]
MAMSKPTTGVPRTPTELITTAREEARFGVDFLRQRWRRLLLVFLGVLLPLWGFGELAEDLRDGEVFFFDAPLLQFAHGLAAAGWDAFFVRMSALGYVQGVVPFDVLLVLVLAAWRKLREGLFAGFAIIGSALLNLGAKQLFARARPTLWESIAPESSFSFPSGHAMGSMTLACVLIMLSWRTHWRWPVLAITLSFVTLVGFSRVYLGVHFPSDILAGWTAAMTWTAGMYLLVYPHGRRPWQRD